MESCIFCGIIEKKISAEVVFEDDDTIVIKDMHPKAPVHWLVMPKKHIGSLNELAADDQPLAGKLFWLVAEMARKAGIATTGYKTVINTGKDGGQAVNHLHVHLMGGKQMGE